MVTILDHKMPFKPNNAAHILQYGCNAGAGAYSNSRHTISYPKLIPLRGGGGVTQGCPYPISQIFDPPISHIPDFFTPNIPYPRFFYPPISHIPDFTVNWPYPRFCKIRMCMYTFIWHTIGENGSNFVGYIYYCCQYTCTWAFGTAFYNVYHSNMYMGSNYNA